MQLGMIGLGRIGANIVRRAMRDGHEAVVYDVRPETVAELEGEGASGTSSLDELASLYERFSSRGEAMYADRLLSAMRRQFGGHAEKVAAGT